MAEEKIVMFLDSLCRNVMGVRVDERCTEDKLVIKNPLVVHMQAANGQIGVQFYPTMFKEFQADKEEPAIITFWRKNVAEFDDMMFDLRLVSQYRAIFAPAPAAQPLGAGQVQPPQPQGAKPQGGGKVINLFDK